MIVLLCLAAETFFILVLLGNANCGWRWYLPAGTN
jgi:hypothetical protein